METYIAILRGINVGGHNKIKMADLKSAMEKAGFEDVTTFIQSGNIIFNKKVTDEKEPDRQVEALISKRFGINVPVIIRSNTDLKHIFEHNPFISDGQVDESKLHVTFLSGDPSSLLIDNLTVKDFRPDQFTIIGKEIYLFCPNGYGRTKLTNTFFESKLNVTATTRNWRTVGKLLELGNREEL